MPYISTKRNRWNDLLTRPEAGGVALEAESAVAADEVGKHEAMFKWVDEMLAAEQPEMRRIIVDELAHLYLTRPGTSRRLHHEVDGCTADVLAAQRLEVPRTDINPGIAKKLKIGMVENCAGISQVSAAAGAASASRCCDWSATTRHASGSYVDDTPGSPCCKTSRTTRGSNASRRQKRQSS